MWNLYLYEKKHNGPKSDPDDLIPEKSWNNSFHDFTTNDWECQGNYYVREFYYLSEMSYLGKFCRPTNLEKLKHHFEVTPNIDVNTKNKYLQLIKMLQTNENLFLLITA